METILEQQRRYHEERERLMDAMVKEMLHRKTGHRENINSEHRLKMLLDQYMDSTMHLQDLYEDKDGQRKEEVCNTKLCMCLFFDNSNIIQIFCYSHILGSSTLWSK